MTNAGLVLHSPKIEATELVGNVRDDAATAQDRNTRFHGAVHVRSTDAVAVPFEAN